MGSDNGGELGVLLLRLGNFCREAGNVEDIFRL